MSDEDLHEDLMRHARQLYDEKVSYRRQIPGLSELDMRAMVVYAIVGYQQSVNDGTDMYTAALGSFGAIRGYLRSRQEARDLGGVDVDDPEHVKGNLQMALTFLKRAIEQAQT